MFEHLQRLDNENMVFGDSGMILVDFILAFIMFGVALDIKISDFKEIIKNPKPIIVGLSAQLLVLPAVTFCLVALCYKLIPPSIAIGMLLVAACPGGNVSNFLSSIARANVALSVTLTSITTILAVLMTPFNFEFWGGMYVRFLSSRSVDLVQPLEISFLQMFLTLLLLIVLPLILGMIVSYFFPKIKQKILKPVKIASMALFVLFLIGALGLNIDKFLNNFLYLFLLVLAHNFILILCGLLWSKLFRLKMRDQHTVGIETGIQNSGLGLALLYNKNIFPQGTITGGMQLLVGWWAAWDLVPGFISALIFRKIGKNREKKQSLLNVTD